MYSIASHQKNKFKNKTQPPIIAIYRLEKQKFITIFPVLYVT